METVDLTDEDVEIVERVRKALRMSRRWAWIKLAVFAFQLGVIVAFSVLLTGFLKDSVGVTRPRDVTLGLALGLVFGLLMGATALSAAKCFGEFMDRMRGNKEHDLLVKCFEIAAGEKQARNLITRRAP